MKKAIRGKFFEKNLDNAPIFLNSALFRLP